MLTDLGNDVLDRLCREQSLCAQCWLVWCGPNENHCGQTLDLNTAGGHDMGILAEGSTPIHNFSIADTLQFSRQRLAPGARPSPRPAYRVGLRLL